MRYTIIIDDDDRVHGTDTPWCAWVQDGYSVGVDESGIGASPLDALADLLHDLRSINWNGS